MLKTKRQKMLTAQRNHERNEEKLKNSGLIILEHKHGKTKYLCPKCNNVTQIRRKTLIRNPICRNCMTGQSFGEQKTIEILTILNIKYQKEKTFKKLKGINGGKLRFDFYIRGKRRDFIIEIDGEQHKNNSTWSSNTNAHDEIKNQFCQDKGIRLYRVNYKFGKLKKLQTEIIKILNVEMSISIQILNYKLEEKKVVNPQITAIEQPIELLAIPIEGTNMEQGVLWNIV